MNFGFKRPSSALEESEDILCESMALRPSILKEESSRNIWIWLKGERRKAGIKAWLQPFDWLKD